MARLILHSARRPPTLLPTRSGERRNPHAPAAHSPPQPLPELGMQGSRTEMVLMPLNQHSRTDGAMPHAAQPPEAGLAPHVACPGPTGTLQGAPAPSVHKGKGTTSVPGHQLAVRAPSPIGLIAEFTLFTLGELASAAAWQ